MNIMYMVVCANPCSQSQPRGTLCHLVRRAGLHKPGRTLFVSCVWRPCAYLVRTLCVLLCHLVRDPAFSTRSDLLVRNPVVGIRSGRRRADMQTTI